MFQSHVNAGELGGDGGGKTVGVRGGGMNGGGINGAGINGGGINGAGINGGGTNGGGGEERLCILWTVATVIPTASAAKHRARAKTRISMLDPYWILSLEECTPLVHHARPRKVVCRHSALLMQEREEVGKGRARGRATHAGLHGRAR